MSLNMSGTQEPVTTVTNDCPPTPSREDRNGRVSTTPTHARCATSFDECCTRTSHRLTPSRSVEQCHTADMSPDAVAKSRCNKPECSYAVLIGIAMRAAQAASYGHRLPVIEIYRFIE